MGLLPSDHFQLPRKTKFPPGLGQKISWVGRHVLGGDVVGEAALRAIDDAAAAAVAEESRP